MFNAICFWYRPHRFKMALITFASFLLLASQISAACDIRSFSLARWREHRIIVSQETQQPMSRLLRGAPIEDELNGGQVRSYVLSLESGQYVHIVIDQKGIDVVVALYGTDGSKITEVDSPNGANGPEPLSFVTETSGTYRLEISSFDKSAKRGRYEAKITELRKALPLDRDRISAERNVAEGALLYAQGTAESLSAAIDKYTKALPLWRSLHDRTGEARTLEGLGDAYDSVGQEQKALDNYNEALNIFRELHDSIKEADLLNNIGYVYWIGGEKQRALEYHNQALILRRANGDRGGQAQSLNNIGLVYADLNEPSRALENYRPALAIWQETNDQQNIVRVLTNIGYAYSLMGEYGKALEYYLETLAPLRALSDFTGEGNTLNNIGGVFEKLGKPQNALQYYTQALQLRRKSGDRRGEAITLNNLGSIYHRSSEYDKALKSFNESLPLRQLLKDRRGEALIRYRIGAVYVDLNKIPQAIENYQKALTLWRDISNRQGEAMTISAIGVAYYKQGEKQKSTDSYNQALQLQRTLGDTEGESLTLENIGYVYEKDGKYQKALEYYEQSLKIQEQSRTAARLEESKASIAAQSIDAYEHAVFASLSSKQFVHAFDLTERSRARMLLDQLGNSGVQIRSGVDPALLQREHQLQKEINEIEQGLREERAKPHQAFDGAKIASLKAAQLSKQQEYDELLTRYKLTNAQYVSLHRVDPLQLREIQHLLDRQTTLLSYFFVLDKTVAFVITRNSLQTVVLPISEREIAALIAWFRSFDNLQVSRPESLKRLFKELIVPVQPYLKTKSIGIIANRVLNYLPFAALSSDHGYFGDRHVLFYLPSGSILQFIKKKRGPVGNRLLALAQSNVKGWPILRYADAEVSVVARIFKTKPLISTASKTDFLKLAPNYNVLHIAAHTELNKFNPLFSSIMLGSDAGESGGVLRLHEIYELNLVNASLVVLSACETQLGPDSKGDDFVTLNRAFIFAGSPTVVATLWKVDDEATSVLMASFYRHLRAGMNKATALREAQRETRLRYPNPYYWAAFVLTGDPGVDGTSK